MAVSAAINGGILYKPYIVKRLIEGETGSIIKESSKVKVRDVITSNTSGIVRDALEHVVSLGSGRNAYIDGYRVGGKTGTAQKVNNGVYMSGNYITSFIGFMPADNPEIVLYVAIDNPKGVSSYGGVVAAPIARSILSDYISIFNLKRRSGGISKEYRYFDDVYVVVPDVIGMSLIDAKILLKDFQVEYSGSGDRILDVSPTVGESIKKNSKIKVMLG